MRHLKPEIALILTLSVSVQLVASFLTSGSLWNHNLAKSSPIESSSRLYSGFGVAHNYTWKEEAFEIDITVPVPVDTRAKNIKFTAKATSIDLRYIDGDEERILLDGSRKLKGRVNLDGTFWVLSDYNTKERSVTITIEKLIATPQDDFEVIEYDWKGVYSNDTEEVVERFYDKPEKLDVREYAASLGVDIDNINMSMVDKTMFSTGLNMTKSGLDQLSKAGYLAEEEITVQNDGKEFTTNPDGTVQKVRSIPKPLPIIDDAKNPNESSDSPWKVAVPVGPVGRDPDTNQTVVQQVRKFTRAAFAEDSATNLSPQAEKMRDAQDPIDVLTVKRLKEILKSQGLKTSGNKAELQTRLRAHVNGMLQGNRQG